MPAYGGDDCYTQDLYHNIANDWTVAPSVVGYNSKDQFDDPTWGWID